MKARRAIALLLATAGAATACAAARPPPPELAFARESLRRAELSPDAPRAPADLLDAKRALSDAERMQQKEPSSDEARDRAYFAWRQAERARIAGLYAADLEALARGRSVVQHLGSSMEQRRADARMQEWLDEAEHQLRQEAKILRERELGRHIQAFDAVEWTDKGPTLVVSRKKLFASGELLLARGAAARIDAAVVILRAGLPPKIIVAVASGDHAKRTGAPLLAQHRAERIRDELVARGYPPELIAIESHADPSERISIAVIDEPE